MPPNSHAAAISSLALCFRKRLLLANALECGSFIKLGQLGNLCLSSKARLQLLPAAHYGVHYILLRKKQQLSGSGMTSQVLCRASGEVMDSEGGYSDIDAGSSDRKVMIRSKRVRSHDVGMNFEGVSLASSVKEQAPTVCRPVAQVGGKRLAKQKRGNEESSEAFEGTESDEMFMREALLEAHLAAMKGEVPVGAVMVHSGRIIARAHNQVEAKGDPTAHAEMRCIQNASQLLGRWRLLESTLYVTLEPCPMCAGAILQARVGELVWGARNTLLGADGSWVRGEPSMDH
ncbi:hypothetical protein O6H91_16G075200 [Diphasiastrum complanatum]|uniref:Uncharacterized protein n=1 Tax=Diphasiastrum complanatum TaxID=34168 RepID=A0ACC2BDP5_DIPCM|nr:hypothetical protein O6H91_16G075200 [Diphasiastrum complanatum]